MTARGYRLQVTGVRCQVTEKEAAPCPPVFPFPAFLRPLYLVTCHLYPVLSSLPYDLFPVTCSLSFCSLSFCSLSFCSLSFCSLSSCSLSTVHCSL